MPRRTTPLGLVALLALGVLVVHELRYRLAYGDSAPQALAQDGHGYLGVVAPVVTLAVMFLVARVLQRCAGDVRGTHLALARLAPAMGLCIYGSYALQELIEGALSKGHANLWAGVFGTGGWWAIPASIVVGFAMALFVRAAERTSPPRLTGVASGTLVRPAAAVALIASHPSPLRSAALAGQTRGRAPPAACAP